MGRPSHPWWWRERGRWAVTVAGRRHLGPPHLTEKDWLAARDWHARLLDEAGEASPRQVGTLLVRDVAEAYLAWDLGRVEEGDRSRRGFEPNVTKISLFCQSVLDGRTVGDRHASRFTASDLDRLVTAWRREGRKEGYIVAVVASVKAMWAWAKRPISSRSPERLIGTNPVEGYRGPPVPQADPRFASRAEAAAWLRWLRDRLWHRPEDRSFVLIQRALIRSGARPSELVRARWRDVDWEGWRTDRGHVGAIVVLERWKAAKKTGRKRRIFLPPIIRRALLRDRSGIRVDPDTPLFTNSDGNPWSNADSLGNRVMRQREAAIRADKAAAREPRFRSEGPEKLVNYRWRHTAASTLLMNGVDVPTVAELLGTSPEMINRTYGHFLNDHLARAASRIDAKR